MVFTDTCTIYNHYTENGLDRWRRTVLPGVMWKRKVIKSVSADGKVSLGEMVSITIPKRAGYVDYKTFSTLDDKSICWTINPSENLDLAVLGVCPAEIDGVNYRLKDIKREYPDVVTVAAVADNTNRDGLPHWRIEAK